MAREQVFHGLTFTAQRAAFLAAVAAVIRVAEARTTIPILGHVLIKGSGLGLTVRASDNVIEATAALSGDVAAGGSLTVPAHRLHDILRHLPDTATVRVETQEDGRVIVSAGRSRFTLPTLSEADFPAMRVDLDGPQGVFELAGGTLSRSLDKISFAISTEETRHYLCGVYLHAFPVEGGATHLRLCATDGHRLGRVDLGQVEGVTPDMPGVIIGRKTVDQIKRLAETAGDAPVRIIVTRNLISAQAGDLTFLSKLVEGIFPAYESVIPKANPHTVKAPTAAFAACCERVALLSEGSEKEAARSISFAFRPGAVTVAASSSDGSAATDEVDVEFDGPELVIRFSPKKLAEILRASGAEVVTIALDAPGSPAVFTHGEASDALHVLMPMRK